MPDRSNANLSSANLSSAGPRQRAAIVRRRFMSQLVSRVILALTILLCGGANSKAAERVVCGATPLQWSVAIAQAATSRLGNVPWFGQPGATLDHASDLFVLSLLRLARRTGDTAMRAYAEDIVGSFVADDGTIRTIPENGVRLDAMPAGLVLIELYDRTHDDKYRIAAIALRQRLARLPRIGEGAVSWAPGQVWLDGLWMSEPFYARYASMFDQPVDFDDILTQYRSVAAHHRDPKTGLYHHAWYENRGQPWANRQTGTSSSFSGRSIGWYAMSLIDTLDSVPGRHDLHPYLVRLLNELAPALAKVQDPASGLWWQVADQGSRDGNDTDTSASAMIVYTLAKAINRGYLSLRFQPAIENAYVGLVRGKIVRDDRGHLSLTGVERRAGPGSPPSVWPPGPSAGRLDAMPSGRDGSFARGVEQPITSDSLDGLGAFILAGLELDKLPLHGPAALPLTDCPVHLN